jgi:hypothetical protein
MVKAIKPDDGRYNLDGFRGLVSMIKAEKKMQPHPHLQEKGVVCSNVECGEPFVAVYGTRHTGTSANRNTAKPVSGLPRIERSDLVVTLRETNADPGVQFAFPLSLRGSVL